MKNKQDVLVKLLSGKTDKCCETCKHFQYSNSSLPNTIHGKCKIDNEFCFTYNYCDDYLTLSETNK